MRPIIDMIVSRIPMSWLIEQTGTDGSGLGCGRLLSGTCTGKQGVDGLGVGRRGGVGVRGLGGGVGVRGLRGGTRRVVRSFKSLLDGASQLARG